MQKTEKFAGSGKKNSLCEEATAKEDEAMVSNNHVTYFARTNYRNIRKPFGIRQADRLAHMYVVGKTGSGKSSLLETMIRQDLENG